LRLAAGSYRGAVTPGLGTAACTAISSPIKGLRANLDFYPADSIHGCSTPTRKRRRIEHRLFRVEHGHHLRRDLIPAADRDNQHDARTETQKIIVRVDTEKHVPVAAATDALGVRLEDRSSRLTPEGTGSCRMGRNPSGGSRPSARPCRGAKTDPRWPPFVSIAMPTSSPLSVELEALSSVVASRASPYFSSMVAPAASS
jgi:hypothetical protein